MAASDRTLRVTNMGPRRNSITSEFEESGYDMLSDITSTSDDDASTDSLSGSMIDDESEGRTTSEFKYDLRDTDSEAEDFETSFRGGPLMNTPSMRPRHDNHEALEDKTLSSSLSVLTERPARSEQSILLHENEKSDRQYPNDIWRKITKNQAFDHTVQAMSSPAGKMVLGLSGFVAMAMLTSSVLSPWFQNGAHDVTRPIPVKNLPAASIQTAEQDSRLTSEEPTHAKNWPQFEQLQQTLEYLKELTSSHVVHAESSSATNSAIMVKSQTSAKIVSVPASSPTKIAKSSCQISKKLNRTRSKRLDKSQYTKEDEKFYVFLDTGRITPFNVGHKLKHKHRFGPFTQVTGEDKKFKVDFAASEGKVKVAFIGRGKLRGSTRIVVSREADVLQRGQLNSADGVISWNSQIKPHQQFGQLQVLFALPTEAVFQVSVLDLGKAPAQKSLQWTSQTEKASKAATDVVRRMTDAINIYVEPHRRFVPPLFSLKQAALKGELNPVTSQVTDVLVRASNRVVAVAESFRSTAMTESSKAVAIAQSFGAVALLDIEAANRCLTQANVKIVSTFSRYRGDVIRAARGAPRQTLSKAQDRVKELKKTMEKKLASHISRGVNSPIQNVKKECSSEKTKPISAWGILGL